MSKAEAQGGRQRRRKAWEGGFTPWALALSGAAVSLAFLFQTSFYIRAAMFLCFLGLAWLAGKKISLLATVLVSLGIVLANLILPIGKVLFTIGSWPITEGALFDGLGKAIVFEGLIYISKATVLPALKIPGKFGSLVAASFVYYDQIVEYKGKVRASRLIEDADRLMLELWNGDLAQAEGSDILQTSATPQASTAPPTLTAQAGPATASEQLPSAASLGRAQAPILIGTVCLAYILLAAGLIFRLK